MQKSNELVHGLSAWRKAYDPGLLEEDNTHLPADVLYQMAEKGGIERARDETLEHLSLCPYCLGKWASWRRAVNDVESLKGDVSEDEESSVPVMALGLREAAATARSTGPFSMKSSCGKFVLSLLPNMENPKKGMITLEALGDEADALEDRKVTVRDYNHFELLTGRLRQGRVARTCEDLDSLDLSAWTVVVDDSAKTP